MRARVALREAEMKATLVICFGVLMLPLLADAVAAQSQEQEQKSSTSSDGRFIVIPKATGLDWALLIDTRTGNTWRLGAVKVPNPDLDDAAQKPLEMRWFWVPIEVCDTCY